MAQFTGLCVSATGYFEVLNPLTRFCENFLLLALDFLLDCFHRERFFLRKRHNHRCNDSR